MQSESDELKQYNKFSEFTEVSEFEVKFTSEEISYNVFNVSMNLKFGGEEIKEPLIFILNMNTKIMETKEEDKNLINLFWSSIRYCSDDAKIYTNDLKLKSKFINKEKSEPKVKTISFYAKTNDLFNASLYDKNNNVLKEYEGYPPSLFSEDGNGISLEIDIETGKILNWRKPSKEDIEEFFNN